MISILPRAAAMTVERWTTDPVTEVEDTEENIRYLADPEITLTPSGLYEIAYTDGSDEQIIYTVTLTGVEQVGGFTTGTVEGEDSSVTIRAVEPYDAVDMSPAGVPQPVDVVEAHVLRGGGMLAGEMDAAVSMDNNVVTLVLDTGLGLYVRYSGDWQLLPETSSSLDGLSLHPVAADAITVYDAADAAAQTVSIFDLPRTLDNYYTDANDREEPEAEVPGPTVAAIDSLLDLSNARVNRTSAAWYVRKRAEALHPSVRTSRDKEQVIVAAGEYLATMREGINADPAGIIRRDLIRRARAAGVLDNPTVVAAIDWRDWLHPRDRNGKFVTKTGMVNVFTSPNPGYKEEPVRGRVKELTQRGVLVEMTTPEGKSLGETRLINPKLLESFESKGNLKPSAAEGGEGKAGTLADTFPQSV
jgi:hypothetical protein